MRSNRRNSIKRERIIMIVSSAFVLAALTMTGVYMRQDNKDSENDGYTVDFTALENNVGNKLNEIAQNSDKTDSDTGSGRETQRFINNANLFDVEDDDLDYMPMDLEPENPVSTQVGSGQVELPELMEGEELAALDQNNENNGENETADQAASGSNIAVARDLHFADSEDLTRPVSGDVLLPYSMDASIYFDTLKQYRYNPAIIFSAEEGTPVLACAEAKVLDVYEDARLGNSLTLDLGDGYQATYGQLKDIQVAQGDYVNAGDEIAKVEQPTRFYKMEGSNLYFKLTRDGEPVNPEEFF